MHALERSLSSITTLDDLGAIIDRIEANTHTPEHLQVLRHYSFYRKLIATRQLNRYGRRIHCGTSFIDYDKRVPCKICQLNFDGLVV